MWIWIILLPVIGAYFLFKKSNPAEKAQSALSSVYKIFDISERDMIPTNIDLSTFRKGIQEYYSSLEKVFNSETEEERKASSDYLKSSPTQTMSKVFFYNTGLPKALVIICKDATYVAEGSGWTEYKKCLLDALSDGAIEKTKDDSVKITFNSNLYLQAKKTTYDYESEYPDYYWNVQVYSKDIEVLSCFGVPDDDKEDKEILVSKFKPDEWVLSVRESADKYSHNLGKMKLKKSTDNTKESFFK